MLKFFSERGEGVVSDMKNFTANIWCCLNSGEVKGFLRKFLFLGGGRGVPNLHWYHESYYTGHNQPITNLYQTTFPPKHIDYTQGLSDVDARTLLNRIDPKVVEYVEEQSYTLSQLNVSFI